LTDKQLEMLRQFYPNAMLSAKPPSSVRHFPASGTPQPFQDPIKLKR